ncbi:MAG: radical SAM protein [Clostridiales bacterium]|nr:radical SAM protein [Clostridiales bacterium]
MSDKKQVLGYVHSTESFGAVDGPGIRFVVFLQGCKMRCKYCHNPETWNLVTDYSKLYSDDTSDAEKAELLKKIDENTKLLKDKGVSIDVRTPEDLLKQALRYKPYWKNGGGITVSGGEALLQMDFLIEFFKLAKAEGIHTTIDTAGNPFTREEPFFSKFNELMNITDLFLLDIKQINDDKHRELTGFSNSNILDLAQYLSDNGKHMWIRHVLVPTITTDEDDLKKTKEFIDTLKTVDKVEVLPYHKLGITEWERLGIPYKLEGIDPPTEEQQKLAKGILE